MAEEEGTSAVMGWEVVQQPSSGIIIIIMCDPSVWMWWLLSQLLSECCSSSLSPLHVQLLSESDSENTDIGVNSEKEDEECFL
jgi:hypothetical protein